MPAGPVGTVWASGVWADTVWELGVWGDAVAAHLLPDNIIVATQSVTDVRRRIAVTQVIRSMSATHARRTVTFDG